MATSCRSPTWSQRRSSSTPPPAPWQQLGRKPLLSHKHQESGSSSPACVHEEHTVSAVARTAQRVCGGAPAADALLAVGLQPGEAVGDAGRALAGLGLRTALDLRIIGGRSRRTSTALSLGTGRAATTSTTPAGLSPQTQR